MMPEDVNSERPQQVIVRRCVKKHPENNSAFAVQWFCLLLQQDTGSLLQDFVL